MTEQQPVDPTTFESLGASLARATPLSVEEAALIAEKLSDLVDSYDSAEHSS
ncbi:hypothetical protein [Rothia sp. CCM 9416]|uniref:hypothetical protein n=1 Tax=Rothia sp. CCM 9416 TaxID=3402655 RepID=UPI003ADD2650